MPHGSERWKPVVGYEMRYEVSDLGRVRRAAYSQGTFCGRLLAGGRAGTRARKVDLWKQGVRHAAYVHVLMAAVFLGKRPPKTVVVFADGNPDNLRVENLCYRARGATKGSHGDAD